MGVHKKSNKKATPPPSWLLKYVIIIILKLSKYIIPFHFENYIHYHFTKGIMLHQTILLINQLIQKAEKEHLSCKNLTILIKTALTLRKKKENKIK